MASYRRVVGGAFADPASRRRAIREAACVVVAAAVAGVVSGSYWFWAAVGVGLVSSAAIVFLELRLASRSDLKKGN